MAKLWLTGLTCKGKLEDLKELIEPIKHHFDGLVWVFNGEKDEGADYLESVKGDGEIIYAKWCNRFDFSRNLGLFTGPIKFGDWFLVVDDQERISEEFGDNLKGILAICSASSIDGIYIRNKHFAFKHNESLKFSSNPHCGVLGTTSNAELEGSEGFKKSYFTNVRPKKRGKFEFIHTNIKYYLYPSTNHLLLHFEKDMEYVNARYAVRSHFLSLAKSSGADITSVESLLETVKKPISEEITKCINNEKILNDWYRFEVKGERDMVDDPHPELIKPI
jgi:hypothetical protein|tara:strand:- start:6122 stop:6952 length:831 start_codon:yes stop_codon:yes gene_type:complete